MAETLEMTLIDRAARAICKARFLNGGIEEDDGWGECSPGLQDDYRRQARALLQAIREPSEAMLKNGGVGFTREWTDPWDELSAEERELLRLPDEPDDRCEEAAEAVRPHVVNTWSAMIDAALEEG